MNTENFEYYENYMRRALYLAEKGEGKVNPNPLVGAVIVKNDEIVGEGYHEYFGGHHAEVNALKMAGDNAKGADVYVTLEPCSHYGKTPPCAEALVKAGVKKVIIAMKDPNKLVAGRGISILESNGIEVVTGVLEKEAKKLNEVFIKYITTKKPYIVLKTAMTLDGKISTVTGKSKWISGEKSREYVHNLRNKYMGIMVGIGTIIADDPLLTTRLKNKKGRNPVAIIVDSALNIPLSSNILNTNHERKIIVACSEKYDKEKKSFLEEKGIKVIVTPSDKCKVNLNYLVNELGKEGIDSILLEGGSTLNFSALKECVVDKVISFIAPKIFGGINAKTPVGGEGVKEVNEAVELKDISYRKIDEDLCIEGYIK